MRFLADEDFNRRIFRGIQRRLPQSSIVRVQDENLRSEEDHVLLEWAAKVGYIVITHDLNTMVGEAYQRVELGLPMKGLIVVPQSLSIGQAIDDIELLILIGEAQDFDNQVIFLPL